jgi:sec-independent protein translocase protein TatA
MSARQVSVEWVARWNGAMLNESRTGAFIVPRMGITELLVILAIFLLLFGAKRLPQLADGLGKSIKNFKRGLNTDDDDVTPAGKQVADTSSASDLSSAEAKATETKT